MRIYHMWGSCWNWGPALPPFHRRGSLSLQIPIAITVHFSAAAPLSQTYQLPSLRRSGRSFPIWRSTRLGWGSTSRPTRPATLTRRRQNLLSDSIHLPNSWSGHEPHGQDKQVSSWHQLAMNRSELFSITCAHFPYLSLNYDLSIHIFFLSLMGKTYLLCPDISSSSDLEISALPRDITPTCPIKWILMFVPWARFLISS